MFEERSEEEHIWWREIRRTITIKSCFHTNCHLDHRPHPEKERMKTNKQTNKSVFKSLVKSLSWEVKLKLARNLYSDPCEHTSTGWSFGGLHRGDRLKVSC